MKLSYFLLGANVHPPNRKTTTPTSPLGPPALWPHTGCVKMGSCIPPLVTFFNLCIFALVRKVSGGKPKKGKWRGNLLSTLPSLSLHQNHLHPPLSTSILLLYLPWPSPLVPIKVWWWGMTPMCPFSDFKKRNHVPAGFWKFFFQKMDLPLPWFCSSFWKVKIC